MKSLIILILFIACSTTKHKERNLASTNIDHSLSENGLREYFLTRTSLNKEQIDNVIKAMKNQVGTSKLDLKGALKSRGFNAGCFVDKDIWNVKVETEIDGEIVQIKDQYEMEYANGGFIFELCYKWVFLFPHGGIKLNTLDKAEFKRGLNITIDLGIGVDLGYIPGDNTPGGIFVLAPKVGAGAGLTFPRVKFRRKR